MDTGHITLYLIGITVVVVGGVAVAPVTTAIVSGAILVGLFGTAFIAEWMGW